MDKNEIKELTASNYEKVLEALDRGDVKEARRRVQLMEKEAKHAHDLVVDFVSTLLTYIGSTYGDAEVFKALHFRHSVKEQVAERMLGMSPEDAVRFKTMIHRAHHSKMTLTEEKERYVLKLDPCNTGGRMLREGLSLGKTKKGCPESWGKADVPYYCAHCAFLSLISVKKGAPHPTWIYERPENPDDPCYQYCYKRTKDVPEKYFEQLGLKKPASRSSKRS